MTPRPVPDLTGTTIVVTGASAGIGAEAARQLAAAGAEVAVVGRSAATDTVAGEIGARAYRADFTSFATVRDLAGRLLDDLPRIDVLVHNAGAMFSGPRVVTSDGHERTMQANYFSPFLLQRLLHERLVTSRARIVITSSGAHAFARLDLDDLDAARGRFSASRVYGASKLADLLFSREIARRGADTGLTSVAFHPGAVASSFGRDLGGILRFAYTNPLARRLLVTTEQGAEPLVHLASMTPTEASAVSGQYFHQMRGDARSSAAGRDAELARRLWDRTEELLDL